MRRCLVTGADGFIGSALCERLADQGLEIIPLTRKPGLVNAIVADLGREPVPSLKRAEPDVIFHLAARVHEFDSGAGAAAEHQRVTVEGTRELLKAAGEAGAKSFVFFSTCAVMPIGVDGDLDEQVEVHPTTAYGRAKLTAERLVMSTNGVDGLKTVCLRLPTVYGPGHKGQLRRMIDAIQGRIFPPIPELGGARSYVHVQDAVEAAILSATSRAAAGNVYIAAEERPYTSRQIYDLVLQALGRRQPRWQMPRFLLEGAARSGDLLETVARHRAPFDSDMLDKLSQPARYSAALIRRELGFRPQHSLEGSMSELVFRPS